MKIYLASDHAGFKLKNEVFAWVKEFGFEPVDLGPFAYKEGDDYPEFIKLAAKEVAADPANCKAIVIGGSGEGEAMMANRFPKVRAVAYYGGNREIIKLSRQHNDSNILSLGARFINDHEAKEMVHLWLTLQFSNEPRHIRRIKEIEEVTHEKWFKKLLKYRPFRR
jgi:ribose 5-phosphate isomerase B